MRILPSYFAGTIAYVDCQKFLLLLKLVVLLRNYHYCWIWVWIFCW